MMYEKITLAPMPEDAKLRMFLEYAELDQKIDKLFHFILAHGDVAEDDHRMKLLHTQLDSMKSYRQDLEARGFAEDLSLDSALVLVRRYLSGMRGEALIDGT